MTTEERIADAFRQVAIKLETAIDQGHRSTTIDANDLLETMLAVADELDPQFAGPTPTNDAG